MRYACPSCKRVFYLETKTVSPCPACGTTLTVEGDESGGGEAAAPPAAQTDAPSEAGGSWLVGGGESEAPTQPSAAAPSSAPPGPAVTSWLTPPAAESAVQAPEAGFSNRETIGLGPDDTATPPSDADSPEAALEALNEAARPSGPSTSAFPAGGPRTTRMHGARGPSGSRVFLLTSAAIIVTVVLAAGLIFLLRGRLPTAPTGGDDVSIGGKEELASALRTKIREAEGELAEERKKVLKHKEENRALDLELQAAKREVSTLKERLGQQAAALGYVVEAQALLERHADLDGALSLVDAALKRDPGLLQARRLKGRVLAASGLAQAAVDAFEQADKAAKDAGEAGDAEALVLAGETCLSDLGDKDRALGYYRRASEMDTSSSYKLAGDARANQVRGRSDRAVAKAGELAKAEPALALAPLILGEILFEDAVRERSSAKRGSLLEKADLHLTRALKLDPNSARACLARGRLLLEQSKLASSGFAMARFGPQSRAERLLATAKKLKPMIPDVHVALAELSLASGALRDPAGALQSATEAVRLTSRKDATALALLAQAYAATGNPSRAIVAIKEAMTISPKNKEYLDLLKRYQQDSRSMSN